MIKEISGRDVNIIKHEADEINNNTGVINEFIKDYNAAYESGQKNGGDIKMLRIRKCRNRDIDTA